MSDAPDQTGTDLPQIDLAQAAGLVTSSIPFVERTGMTVDVLERGHVKMTCPLAPNVNHIGTMYAGALFTLAEVPGGALFLASFDLAVAYPIVRRMDIRFLAPATTDVTVEVRMADEEIDRLAAETEANGKANYSWECELRDTTGKVVASTVNDYQMRRHET